MCMEVYVVMQMRHNGDISKISAIYGIYEEAIEAAREEEKLQRGTRFAVGAYPVQRRNRGLRW